MSQFTQLPENSAEFEELTDPQMVSVNGGKKRGDTVVITQPIITGYGYGSGFPIVPINTVITGGYK